jgi:hypothetical protein
MENNTYDIRLVNTHSYLNPHFFTERYVYSSRASFKEIEEAFRLDFPNYYLIQIVAIYNLSFFEFCE